LTNFAFYQVVALAGYFSTYEMTNKITIDRDPPLGYANYPLFIGKVMLVFIFIIAFSLNTVPLRKIFTHTFLGIKESSQ
jgi:hypothetical protein